MRRAGHSEQGRHAPRRRLVVALLTSALLLQLVPLAAPRASATVLLRDDFESGDLSAWSEVRAEGGGTAIVQSQVVAEGSAAARMTASSTSGSRAYMRHGFSSPATELNVRAAVRVEAEGPSGSNVPLLRLFDDGGRRVVNVYRQNQSWNQVWVQHSGGWHLTTGRLPLHQWQRLEVRVSTATSTIEIILDGVVVHRSAEAELGTSGVRVVQFGNEIAAQPFDLVADNVEADTGTTEPPPDDTEPPPPEGTCSSAGAPSNGDPGTTVIADGFESGDLRQWTKVTEQGSASATVQQDDVKNGGCALQLHVTADRWDSRANVTKTLPTGTTEVWATGWFKVQREGADGWNTPTFRVFTNGKRIFDISRQNGDGNLFVRWPDGNGGSTIPSTGRRLSLGRWYDIKIHLVASGNNSTVEVWLDGTKVHETHGATFGVANFDVLMVGAEHQKQEGDTAVDDVVVKAITADPGNSVFADGFESGSFNGWTSVVAESGATALVQSGNVQGGTYAARLTATGASGSRAYVRRVLSTAPTDLNVAAAVAVETEGSAAGFAPILELVDPDHHTVVRLHRLNGTGRLIAQYGGVTADTGVAVPLGTWFRVDLRAVTAGADASAIEVRVDGAVVHATTTADLAFTGVKTLQIGTTSGTKGYAVALDDVVATEGDAGPQPDPRHKLLIADYLNRRLLITDFDGNVVWRFDNPTRRSEYSAGPIGVRWLPGNKILATFGTGEVGVIDVGTKTWDWKVWGYGGENFESPYDAELLPDGRLAVAMRFKNGGRVSVYDRGTGKETWRHYVPQAHSVRYRTPAQSHGTDQATLLVGGFGYVREVTYDSNSSGQSVAWQVKTEYTHDAIVVESDHVITTEGYYIQKIDRSGVRRWRHMTPDEDRRVAMNPNRIAGYIFTVAESDRIEFRTYDGNLVRDWSRLSDGTHLDYPYGIQVIQYGT